MADNWDDEDFEPEVSKLAPPPPPPVVAVEPKATPAAVASKSSKQSALSMESLGRELTGAEREAMQRKTERAMNRDLFGLADDGEDEYADIIDKDDFEKWGENVGRFLNTRYKATHYGDMISKLFVEITANLEAADVRKMANHLKAIADAAKKAEEKPKVVAAVAAATGKGAKNKKPQLNQSKGAKSAIGDEFADDAGYDQYDDYDDFM